MKDKEEMIRQVRQVGESLIKNAESIVGDYKYGQSLEIHADIWPCEYEPQIRTSRTFVPEKFVESNDWMYKDNNGNDI